MLGLGVRAAQKTAHHDRVTHLRPAELVTDRRDARATVDPVLALDAEGGVFADGEHGGHGRGDHRQNYSPQTVKTGVAAPKSAVCASETIDSPSSAYPRWNSAPTTAIIAAY